jgi:hypothetical protein
MANGFCSSHFLDSKISWLATDLMFIIPGLADWISWFGCGPVGKANFERLASQGHNIALLPGGFEEATIYAYGQHRVYIKDRKGFIKMALKYGYTVRTFQRV